MSNRLARLKSPNLKPTHANALGSTPYAWPKTHTTALGNVQTKQGKKQQLCMSLASRPEKWIRARYIPKHRKVGLHAYLLVKPYLFRSRIAEVGS